MENENRIIIGAKYSNYFKSIVELYKNGGIEKGIIEKIDFEKNIIYEANTGNVFIYDEHNKDVEKENAETFLEEGASWFNSLRNSNDNNGLAAWTNLLEAIPRGYHSKYSIFETSQKDTKITGEDLNKQNLALSNVAANLFPNHKFNFSEYKPLKNGLDLYIAHVKLSVGDVGENSILIGRIYFSKVGRKFIPLKFSPTSNIDEKLGEISSDELTIKELGTEESENIRNVARAIEDLISNTDEKKDFKEYIIYQNKELDGEIIKGIISKSAEENNTVICNKMNLYSISHIKTNIVKYEISENGEVVLIATFDFLNGLSLKCNKCKTSLIENNIITINKEGKDCNYNINPLMNDLGLESEEIADILKYSINKHLFKINCPSGLGHKNCSKILCFNSCIYDENKNDYKCKNCPYPSVVYQLEDGSYQLTRNLTYVSDKHKFVLNREAKRCSMCDRTFTKNEISNGQCKFCNNIINDDYNIDAKKTYKKYKDLLSIYKRAFSLFSKKAAYEDDERIVFKINNKYYYVKKVDISEHGMLPTPKKMR